MAREIWKIIEDYPNYSVSTFGRVKNNRNNHILTHGVNTSGYPSLRISNSSGRKTFRVHRLVATAFIENPDKKEEVNHKDEVKTNNYVENLEWLTRSENFIYGTGQDRAAEAREKAIIQLDKKTSEQVAIFDSISDACFSIGIEPSSGGNIGKVAKGERKSAYGYGWRFLDG